MGLSSTDATNLDPGLSVRVTPQSATTSMGGMTVTVTSPSAEIDTTIVSNGVRMMSLLERGDSTASFGIELPPNTVLLRNGEGYTIRENSGGSETIVGQIHDPWAVDALGKRLPTSYELEENTLLQHVLTDSATYPIVADPLISIGLGPDGLGTYLNITGANAKVVAGAVVAVGGLGIAGGCVAAGRIPRVGYIIQGICTFVGIPSLKSVVSAISSIVQSTALANDSCYSLRLQGGTKFNKVDAGYCQ
jgi:hypothetical protein